MIIKFLSKPTFLIKTKSLYFPHINRIINADLQSPLLTIIQYLLLIVLIICTFLNFHTQIFPENEEYIDLRLQTLKSPTDYRGYVNLATYLNNHGSYDESSKYFQMGQFLYDLPLNRINSKTKVLGETNSPLSVFRNLSLDRNRLKEEINYWQKIISEKPNFRDGYLELVRLSLNLGDLNKAKEYFQKVIEIDPLFRYRDNYEVLLKKAI